MALLTYVFSASDVDEFAKFTDTLPTYSGYLVLDMVNKDGIIDFNNIWWKK